MSRNASQTSLRRYLDYMLYTFPTQGSYLVIYVKIYEWRKIVAVIDIFWDSVLKDLKYEIYDIVLLYGNDCMKPYEMWMYKFSSILLCTFISDLVETPRSLITLGTKINGGLEQKGIKNLQDCIKVLWKEELVVDWFLIKTCWLWEGYHREFWLFKI